MVKVDDSQLDLALNACLSQGEMQDQLNKALGSGPTTTAAKPRWWRRSPSKTPAAAAAPATPATGTTVKVAETEWFPALLVGLIIGLVSFWVGYGILWATVHAAEKRWGKIHANSIDLVQRLLLAVALGVGIWAFWSLFRAIYPKKKAA